MGNCLSSCLPVGGRQRRGLLDGDNETQNLFDDPHVLQYGSFDQHHDHGREDPLEVQREIEALQRIIARTSDNLIDIFEFGPQERIPMQDTSSAAAAESSSYSYTPDAPISAMMPAALGPGQHDVRMARYQTLLSKLAALDDSGDEDNAFVLAKGKAKAKPRGRREAGGGAAVPVRVDSGGEPLVGNFSDAAAAMR